MSKESLEIEYKVFSRMLDHWWDFEREGLPIVLDRILSEILNDYAKEE